MDTPAPNSSNPSANSGLMFDISDMSAEVYAQSGDVYFVKVNFPAMGMYINSWSVRPSPRYPEKGLWVQSPGRMLGKRWLKFIEFKNDSRFFDLIKDEVLRAVDQYQRDKDVSVEDIEGVDIRRQIDEIFPGSEQISP